MAFFEFKNISDVKKTDIKFGDQWVFVGWPELVADQDMDAYFKDEDKARAKRDKIAEEIQKKIEKSNSGNGQENK